MQGNGEDQMKQQQENQQQNEARRLKDTQRGAKQWGLQLKEFERAKKSYEKGGGVVEQSTNDDLQKAKDIIQAIKNAKTGEELDAIAGDELNGLMQSLEENRRDIFEAKQRLDDMRRGMKGMGTNLKQLERQITNLAKKKIVIPTEITENVTKVRAIITAVTAAKTWEEAETAGIEDLQDSMQALDESRQQLEMLARWPQTLKQINNELKNLDRQLKRDKIIVERLAKKEIDMSVNLGGFNDAIAKLKAVRDDATAKIAAGDSEGAFDVIESDFFGQMEDVWQFDRVIQTMNNLGQFKSDFKKRAAQADSMIKKWSKKKDVIEAKELLAELKAKGNEILEMIKSKDIDEDTVMSALSEMEDIGQQFEDVMSELTGESEEMPWETGPQQFKQVQMPSSVSRNIPQKTVQVQQPMVQQPVQQQVNNVVVQ
jgi:chromosome segregation ATPase